VTYRLSRRAKSHLDEIWEYIAADSVDAADQTVTRLVGAIEQLVQFPRSARAGLVEGTRELVIAPYRITYKIESDLIYIVSVIHGKRER
jgi:plasmid stabilization system protein ParE